MGRCDSVLLELHKWFEVGFILVCLWGDYCYYKIFLRRRRVLMVISPYGHVIIGFLTYLLSFPQRRKD